MGQTTSLHATNPDQIVMTLSITQTLKEFREIKNAIDLVKDQIPYNQGWAVKTFYNNLEKVIGHAEKHFVEYSAEEKPKDATD